MATKQKKGKATGVGQHSNKYEQKKGQTKALNPKKKKKK